MASRYPDFDHFRLTLPAPFVAHLEINRPSKLNALAELSWREFSHAFRLLSVDPDVRAVVVSGAGDRAFCAGLDVQAAVVETRRLTSASDDVSRRAVAFRRHIADFQECIGWMERCEKPVICVLHGIAIGLGVEIACCADVRLCATDTRFAVKEVDIGTAADIGTLARLPKLVGSASWVKDVCLTARDFSADEALSAGFVSSVYRSKADAIDAGLVLAGSIAEKSPIAVQGTKELLGHARDHPVQENLRYTAVWNSAMVQSEDFKAALMSGLTKKKATFEKL